VRRTYYERNLPHWHPEGKALFVTWRLSGSLPAWARRSASAQWGSGGPDRASARGLESPRHQSRVSSAGKRFLAMDQQLDRTSHGPKWLQDERVAGAVVAVLKGRGTELAHYRLHAFVVMPNHVHMLMEPCIDPVRALRGIKGASARAANLTLGRTGRPFWQSESFDHWVRSGAELEKIRRYIERNPVSAGLVTKPGEWRWSSASRGAGFSARALVC
jgi:REP-associated tyrosine transposase